MKIINNKNLNKLIIAGFIIFSILILCYILYKPNIQMSSKKTELDYLTKPDVTLAIEKTNPENTSNNSDNLIDSTTIPNTKPNITTTTTNIYITTTQQEVKNKEIITKQTSKKKYYSSQDAIDIAKVMYVECGGIQSKTEQACVAWTILNRVDKYNNSIYKIVRAPNQFAFYSGTSIRQDLLELSYDVLDRWSREKDGETNVGRVLPKEYMFFVGDGHHNYFRTNYKSPYKTWDYSLKTPYEN